MFYMEAQNKIAESPLCSEIQGGELVLTDDPQVQKNPSKQTGAKPKRKSNSHR